MRRFFTSHGDGTPFGTTLFLITEKEEGRRKEDEEGREEEEEIEGEEEHDEKEKDKMPCS